jgi:hypothetical protein
VLRLNVTAIASAVFDHDGTDDAHAAVAARTIDASTRKTDEAARTTCYAIARVASA